jgi:hypothetical protein
LKNIFIGMAIGAIFIEFSDWFFFGANASGWLNNPATAELFYYMIPFIFYLGYGAVSIWFVDHGYVSTRTVLHGLMVMTLISMIGIMWINSFEYVSVDALSVDIADILIGSLGILTLLYINNEKFQYQIGKVVFKHEHLIFIFICALLLSIYLAIAGYI